MTAPRSLADDLRDRTDEDLARLLARRPDLVQPVARDMHAFTARATSGPSLARCIDGLDALTLHVLATAAHLTREGTASDSGIIDACVATLGEGTPTTGSSARDECAHALHSIVELALIWGTADKRRVVQGVHDLLRPMTIAPWPQPVLTGAASRSTGSVDVDVAASDARAGLHAHDLIVSIRDLLDEWSAEPPTILRTGGLALRDLASAGRLLHRGPAETATIIEIAHAASLVVDDQDAPAHWTPTDNYDLWQALPRTDQWLAVIHAWLALPRLPSLADERTQILVETRDRKVIPLIRLATLQAWASGGVGYRADVAEIERVLDFAEPRRAGELRRLTIEATVREAEFLGLSSGAVLSSAAHTLLDDSLDPDKVDAHARQVLGPTLPEEIDHFLVQLDLTVVAPGPLVSDVARRLRIVADIESRGHATVYRVTEESLTRAFDSGWDADAIEGFFTDASSTALPQPLIYLIHDTARRHGTMRVGNALGYIRCDNAETLATALHDKRLAKLSLSRLADTVLISPYPATELITALRAAGYAPAAEGSDGRMLIHRPADKRVRSPKVTKKPAARNNDALIASAIRALRAGEQAHRARSATTVPGPASNVAAPRLSKVAVSTTIKKAVLEHVPLWIGYAELDGTVTEQLVDPIRISAGSLTAFDHRSETVRTFAIARITGVAKSE